MVDNGWPFGEHTIYQVCDYQLVPCGRGYEQGGAAFCCRQGHVRIIQDALMDGVEPVIIFEDDACWKPDFVEQFDKFWRHLPDDWEGVYLGGNHCAYPEPVNDYVVKGKAVELTHAYAVRRRYMRDLYAVYSTTNVHIDWAAKDLMAQGDYKIYCPREFLVGQGASHSDIRGAFKPTRFGNQPPPNLPIAILHVNKELIPKLHAAGWHTGFDLDDQGVDVGVGKAMMNPNGWFRTCHFLTSEVWDGNGRIPALWHPDRISPRTVGKHWPGPVVVVAGKTVAECEEQWTTQLS